MEITFSKNGAVFPKAFDIPKELQNSVFFPAVVLKNAEMQFNFGVEAFKYPPKDGFIAICDAPAERAVNSEIHGKFFYKIKFLLHPLNFYVSRLEKSVSKTLTII